MSIKNEVTTQVIHAVPPVGVLGVVMADITLSEIQSIVAITVLILQGCYWLWKWRKESKKEV